MSPELRQMVVKSDEVGLERAWFDGDCPEFVAVDWRGDDAEIVAICAEALGLESLAAEWRDEALFILYDGREVCVPLLFDEGDRHIAICTLNDVLGPQYEARFLVCSHGSDMLGLAPLPTADWRALEQANAAFVAENFIDPRWLPNLFTELTDDTLPAVARARYKRMIARN